MIFKKPTRSLVLRHRQEKRFRLYGLGSTLLSFGILSLLLWGIFLKGYPAFFRFEALVHVPIAAHGKEETPDFSMISQTEKSLLSPVWNFLGPQDFEKPEIPENFSPLPPSGVFVWIPVEESLDLFLKRTKGKAQETVLQDQKDLDALQQKTLRIWQSQGRLQKHFYKGFLTQGDSRWSEAAGLGGSLVGTLYTLLVTMIVAFPLGIFTAVYLEEFAPRTSWVRFIEVNINNLASVPSIVFGLLGLAIFINFFGIPRSSSLVGGLTLSLMTIPLMVISTRTALQGVPRSIRQAALALGASEVQVTLHHVVPLALPGIITGALLSLSRALGESAPLIIIGMVAFIADVPQGVLDPATTLPVQIFSWARSPEQGFLYKAAGAILVLLGFLVVLNGLALWIQHAFEKRGKP